MTPAPRSIARRLVGRLPDPLLERASLAQAARLEARVRRSPAVRGAALLLHSVAARGGRHGLELDPPLASAQLDAIAGHLADRYRTVRAGELLEAARRRRAGEPIPVAITFDDDLPCHASVAAPILARHGVVATAFLCGAEQPFWWQLLQRAVDDRAIAADALDPLPPRLVEPALLHEPGALGCLGEAIERLSPSDRDAVAARLREAVPAGPAPLSAQGRAELLAAGWEIGFHTSRHDLVTTLDDEALAAALTGGRDGLGDGTPRTLAYPHGKAGPREGRAAREAGYLTAYTGRPEVITARTDEHLVGRITPRADGLGSFALQLARALALPGVAR